MKCLKMHGADREPRPDWIIFTRGTEHPVSKSMELMEVFAVRRFVRPVGTSGGLVSSLACLTFLCFCLLVSVLCLGFVFLFFLAGRKLRGFSQSRAEKGEERTASFFWRTCLMWR